MTTEYKVKPLSEKQGIIESISKFIQTVIRTGILDQYSILTIALINISFIPLGIVLTTAGNPFALKSHDQLVNKAIQ